jgi:hypothetical protein
MFPLGFPLRVSESQTFRNWGIFAGFVEVGKIVTRLYIALLPASQDGRQDFPRCVSRFESNPYRRTRYLVSKRTPFDTPLDVTAGRQTGRNYRLPNATRDKTRRLNIATYIKDESRRRHEVPHKRNNKTAESVSVSPNSTH